MFNKMNLKLLGLALSATLGFTALSAQDCDQDIVNGSSCDTSYDFGSCDSCEQTPTCSPYALKIGYTTPRSIPTKEGYTTLAAFYCPSNFDCWAPYADVRFHWLDNGRFAGNVGLGLQRRIFSCWGQSIWRSYVYYDWRKTSFRNYSQVAFGTEWLGERFDVRANVYLPTQRQGHAHDVRTFHFRGGYHAKRERLEYTWRGVELDISKRLCFFNRFDLYLTAGPYWWKSRHNSTAGAKFRAETTIWKGLNIAVQTSYDKHFKNRTFGEISWSMPLWGGCGCAETCCEPVRRTELIVLNKHCHWKTNY